MGGGGSDIANISALAKRAKIWYIRFSHSAIHRLWKCSSTINFTTWKWHRRSGIVLHSTIDNINIGIPRKGRNHITKTCLYNFDPLKPYFYIAKLGFTGVYIIVFISAKKIDCGYSLEPPRRGDSNEYPQSMFWTEIWKNIRVFYLKIFSFWWWNFLYVWIGVFS